MRDARHLSLCRLKKSILIAAPVHDVGAVLGNAKRAVRAKERAGRRDRA